MKRLFIVVFLVLVLGPSTAWARGAVDAAGISTLCLPGVYAQEPEECLPLGPSQYLTEMASIGMRFPMQPLAARPANPDLAAVPYLYAKINSTEKARVFPTAEDAAAGTNVKRTIDVGFNYISFIDSREIDGKRYYMIAPGEWMRRDELSSIGLAPSLFMGLEFSATPANKFGWVLFPMQPQRAPGLNNVQFNGPSLVRYDLVQAYDTRVADGIEWHLIAPDQWVDGRYVSLVYPASAPPEGVTNGRWIEINLGQQTISVYQDNHLVYATLVSSGVYGFWTRPGLFQITEKVETTPMTGAFEADRSDFYYLEDVLWTMYFDQARALHGAYWHNNFGYRMSHGCANLSPGDSRWLYDWAQVGDWVYVWDPSGLTPTDPALYGEGGA